MSNTIFAFRQFSIRQDRCGMKVSSDACIFGAWIPVQVHDEPHILDIGTGTGLLSLMIAQRAPGAVVHAVEIDAAAAAQATDNVDDSIFRGRIKVFERDVRGFRPDVRYDLIVSNPPFFSKSLRSPDAARNAARHDDRLDLPVLFDIAARMLGEAGRFALLMPFDAGTAVLDAATTAGLTAESRLDILVTSGAAPKRSCWVFSRPGPAATLKIQRLVVREGAAYTQALRDLLGEFYLRC